MRIDYDNKGCLYVFGVVLIVVFALANPVFAAVAAMLYFGAGALGGRNQ